MYLALGLIFMILGGAAIFAPEVIYELKETWKHRGYTEPSEKYLWVIRAWGILYVVVGLASVILQFVI